MFFILKDNRPKAYEVVSSYRKDFAQLSRTISRLIPIINYYKHLTRVSHEMLKRRSQEQHTAQIHSQWSLQQQKIASALSSQSLPSMCNSVEYIMYSKSCAC